MKGAYPTLSHSLLILLGLTAMSMIVASLSISFLSTEKDLSTVELNFIADSVKNKMMDAYSLANQSSDYSTGYFHLSLPEKIGNRRYTITLTQKKLFVNESVTNGQIEVSRDLNIDAELSGSVSAPASIRVDKQNGMISMELVK